MVETPPKSVNCRRCRHYYVTWDKKFPQGCKLYGVKSKQAPSIAVLDATGDPCAHWQENPKVSGI
ncbi:MAG: uracil-DNA glycosylase [Betaproteobacteria bacterium]|nr:uracil-DNA glycosylase [Betaproteobacteria bacterium]